MADIKTIVLHLSDKTPGLTMTINVESTSIKIRQPILKLLAIKLLLASFLYRKEAITVVLIAGRARFKVRYPGSIVCFIVIYCNWSVNLIKKIFLKNFLLCRKLLFFSVCDMRLDGTAKMFVGVC